MAGEPGEQTLILAFDAPQAIRRVALEVEETGGRPHPGTPARRLHRRRADLPGGAAPGVQLQPAGHDLRAGGLGGDTGGVTHLRLVIKPDKGGKPCRATITSLVLR